MRDGQTIKIQKIVYKCVQSICARNKSAEIESDPDFVPDFLSQRPDSMRCNNKDDVARDRTIR